MVDLQKKLRENFSSPDPQKARQICQEQEIIGIGQNRIVISSSQDILKLAWREEGLRDNEIEYLLYQKASPELSALLCPTKELYEDGAIRQSRCQPLSFKDLGPEGRMLISRLSAFGLSDAAVNIGELNGLLVCYDYSLLAPQLLGELLWEKFYR